MSQSILFGSISLVLSASIAILPLADIAAQSLPPACAAADSLLGPATPAQLKAKVDAAYHKRSNNTNLFTRFNVSGPVSSAITVQGELPVYVRPAGRLTVVVPIDLTDKKVSRGMSLYALIDDSVQVSIGPATLNDWIGTYRPRDLPVDFEVSAEKLLQLARAHSVSLTWFNNTFKASPGALAALNAMYRIVLCARPHLDDDLKTLRVGDH